MGKSTYGNLGAPHIADQDDDHFCSSPYLRYQVGVPMTGNGFKYNLDTETSIVQSGILFSSAFLLLTLHVFVGFYCSRSISCLEVLPGRGGLKIGRLTSQRSQNALSGKVWHNHDEVNNQSMMKSS